MSYLVSGYGVPKKCESIEEAIQEASRMVTAPWNLDYYKNQLEETGATQWAYGFSVVAIDQQGD